MPKTTEEQKRTQLELQQKILKCFSDKLQKARKGKHLSQEEVAGICHISTRHYQDIEKGNANPGVWIAVCLAKLLDISLDSLTQEVQLNLVRKEMTSTTD